VALLLPAAAETKTISQIRQLACRNVSFHEKA